MHIFLMLCMVFGTVLYAQSNNKIMVTGYWPPTNKMVKKFSKNLELNPDGWQGKNWREMGYDVYSFFPTFSDGLGKGEGEMQVDYQATSADFWRIVDEVKPIAILSFGLGKGPWEVEVNARNLNAQDWRPDYKEPFIPPQKPDGEREDGYVLHSSLPVENIVEAVNNAEIGVEAWADYNGNPGAFLCEYLAYHVMWYQDLHKNDNTHPCLAAGFIHVGEGVNDEQALHAFELTLEETIKHVNSLKTANTEKE